MAGSKKRSTKRAEGGPAAEGAGRLGLVSRGAMYCIGAFLAIRLVTGADERVDKDGALEALARQRVGSILLVTSAVGFAGYAIWRLIRGVTGAREGSRSGGRARVAARAADFGRCLIYVVMFVTTVRLLMGGSETAGGEEKERDWTESLLAQSWGRPIVAAAGILAIGIGLVLAWRGLGMKFKEKLDLRRVPSWARGWLPTAGTVDYVARGGVLALVGWFIVSAAIHFDPGEAVGVAGALGRLSGDLYGRLALSVIAAGLLSYGVFSFVEAGFRKVLQE